MNTTSPSTTHYPAATVKEAIESHTLAVIVDNEPGVLARVIGLFSGRGYNIESLTVSETEHEKHLSRITIMTRGTPMVIEQIKNQLDRMVPVHRVVDMTIAGPAGGRRGCEGGSWRSFCPSLRRKTNESRTDHCLLPSTTTTSVGSGSWGVRLVQAASLQLARLTTVPAGASA